VGFIVSLVVAYESAKYSTDDFANSAITVIAGFFFAKIVFVVLFHLDNRKKYTKRFSGKLNFPVLKQIVKKMLFADSIFEIVSNVTRFFLLLQLLKLEYPPVQAATKHRVVIRLFSNKPHCKTDTRIWHKEKDIFTKMITALTLRQ